ncbi:hypothetical protein L596_027562 [Steinernema carpocapsae]|uniref:Asparagine synthetase [glutamine-hydrolyzing] n=1 Tax=Steinernema carpocapsae TaxID=34508 RepID=A0A4U5LVW7_STECR|nr:hypothetical protein L596_027562 [Steinernema carpocapsae]
MCGIWALLGSQCSVKHSAEFMKIVGRGPDLTVISEVQPSIFLGFHRLAIVQPGHVASEQPIVAGSLSVVCNGEIYNHEILKKNSPLAEDKVKNGGSDCASIIHAFKTHNGDIKKCCAALDGVFAFVMVDDKNVYIGRDPIGVRPLFYGFDSEGELVIGSEVKCVHDLCDRVEIFPPGHCGTISLAGARNDIRIQQYWTIPSIPERMITINKQLILTQVREILVSAVQKRLMGNRQFGFMLSGGLDSSLVASIATKFLKDRPVAFSVGFTDSPDLENARKVAEYLDIPHKVLVITPEQCIDIVPEVVYALETFDPLIIRCGIPHFLLCKHIAATSEVKVLLSGEGADELFGSYAYMQRAPSSSHLHKEILRRLAHLHQYDVLRCDRATSCHGLEIRVPFLDKRFIDLVARLPPSFKLISDQMEKYVLRSAFEDWLPTEVLWRSKEGFSEALGKIDLGDVVHEHASKVVSDQQFGLRSHLFPWKTPDTKEEFWYRMLFDAFFSHKKLTNVVHTKVYRTAAWHMVEDKENCKDELMAIEKVRHRRRSTGSTTLSGVA